VKKEIKERKGKEEIVCDDGNYESKGSKEYR
jgi:hypothetical protein